MRKLARIFVSILLCFLGFFALQTANLLPSIFYSELIMIPALLVVCVLFYFSVSIPLAVAVEKLLNLALRGCSVYDKKQLFFGMLGLFLGFLTSVVLFVFIPIGNSAFSHMAKFAIIAFVGLLSAKVAFDASACFFMPQTVIAAENQTHPAPSIKVLDRSTLVDGRITNLIIEGVFEGRIVVPSFVVDEIKSLSESPDALKRNKGRQGLDVINKLLELGSYEVEVINSDVKGQIQENDSFILGFAKDLNGTIITCDNNLAKLAELQKLKFVNITSLSSAVKVVILPGNEMNVFIVKEGKEKSQGVAYLNDGTMIVVENGSKFMEKNIEIVVTSVLQTPAGRMVFGKYKMDTEI